MNGVLVKTRGLKMKEERGFKAPLFALIVFAIIGTSLAGNPGSFVEPYGEYITIHETCNDPVDYDNDGYFFYVDDPECWDNPNEDGGGEINTNVNFQNPQGDYQPLYDLQVDFVLNIVDKDCGGQLPGCLGAGTNPFQPADDSEIDFFCFFSDIIMATDFLTLAQKHRDLNAGWDDGSYTMINSLCNGFPAPSGDLPMITYQLFEDYEAQN